MLVTTTPGLDRSVAKAGRSVKSASPFGVTAGDNVETIARRRPDESIHHDRPRQDDVGADEG